MIREKLAEEINWYGNTCKYIDWNVEGNEETKNYRREQAKDFIAIFKETLDTMELPMIHLAGYGEDSPLEIKLQRTAQQDLLKAIKILLEEK